jgi:hypothetical protein
MWEEFDVKDIREEHPVIAQSVKRLGYGLGSIPGGSGNFSFPGS